MIERLIEFSVRNRLLLLVLAALVVGAGWFSYRSLPVDAFPDVSPNLVQVFTVTEGLAPEEVEKYVTYPVEAAMNGLPGVQTVRSVSNFGLSVVNVYFKDGMDIYFTRQLVNERLQEAREQIPEGFGEPEMGPISTGMGLVLFYYLEDAAGRYSLEELRTIQDWIVKFHLQTVPGVTEVLGERALDHRLWAGLAVFLEQVALERAGVDADAHRAAIRLGGVDHFAHARALDPMLPGLMRRHAAPASAASMARL